MTADDLERIAPSANDGGQSIVRRACGDQGPGLAVDRSPRGQIAQAAACGWTAGTRDEATAQPAQLLGDQPPCPACGRPCPVPTEGRPRDVSGGTLAHREAGVLRPDLPAGCFSRSGCWGSGTGTATVRRFCPSSSSPPGRCKRLRRPPRSCSSWARATSAAGLATAGPRRSARRGTPSATATRKTTCLLVVRNRRQPFRTWWRSGGMAVGCGRGCRAKGWGCRVKGEGRPGGLLAHAGRPAGHRGSPSGCAEGGGAGACHPSPSRSASREATAAVGGVALGEGNVAVARGVRVGAERRSAGTGRASAAHPERPHLRGPEAE